MPGWPGPGVHRPGAATPILRPGDSDGASGGRRASARTESRGPGFKSRCSLCPAPAGQASKSEFWRWLSGPASLPSESLKSRLSLSSSISTGTRLPVALPVSRPTRRPGSRDHARVPGPTAGRAVVTRSLSQAPSRRLHRVKWCKWARRGSP